VEGAAMSARDDILSTLRDRRIRSAQKPMQYTLPAETSDLTATFAERAATIHAEVRILDSIADIPAAIADILRGKNLPAEIHVAPNTDAPDLGPLAIKRTPPGPDDAALTTAPFAIAETGTLAYPATTANPASWHFRPGLEIAVLKETDIVPHMETVIARIKAKGLPHTINFVSGPSRTGDIEQTLELGAHGPKALAILIVKE
jgi:L-lactate dehydrogenase complex protein LldG